MQTNLCCDLHVRWKLQTKYSPDMIINVNHDLSLCLHAFQWILIETLCEGGYNIPNTELCVQYDKWRECPADRLTKPDTSDLLRFLLTNDYNKEIDASAYRLGYKSLGCNNPHLSIDIPHIITQTDKCRIHKLSNIYFCWNLWAL